MGYTIFVYHFHFEVAIWVTGKYEHISILVQLAENCKNCKLPSEACLFGCCIYIERIWFMLWRGASVGHFDMCLKAANACFTGHPFQAAGSQQAVRKEKEANYHCLFREFLEELEFFWRSHMSCLGRMLGLVRVTHRRSHGFFFIIFF